MAAAFSCLILFTVLVTGIISFSLTSEAVEKNSREYVYQLIEQVNSNIESYIVSMENISLTALYSNDIREYLSKKQLSTNEATVYSGNIYRLFNSVLSSRSDISSIMVFGNNGRVVIANENRVTQLNPYNNPKDQAWYKKAVEAGGEAVVSSSHVQNVLEEASYRWVVSLSREMVGADGEKLGVFLVDLNYSVINDMCSRIKLGNRGYIFIIDNEGNIVYHPQQQLVYTNIKKEMINEVLNSKSNYFITNEGNDSRIYNIKESAHTGWKIVGVAYLNELVSNKEYIKNSYFLWGFISLLIAILLSIFLSLRISKPVRKLESSMRKVENGNFDIKVDVVSSDEIGELSKTFNIMIAKIKELMLQNTKEQELKRKSELKALQAQINPHFLYNTLDSIVWMAEGKKSEEVVRMTAALARLFRLSISKGEEIIPASDEIEHIRNYLTIQKMRYRDKLDFEIDVDKEVLPFKVLKIILQPLVENSIYHGIKNQPGIGLIRITGKKTDYGILLQVSDNGVGMTEEKARHILENPSESPKGSGVGVKNVNERIKLYFGDEFGLSFESRIDEGTTVSIRLPAIE